MSERPPRDALEAALARWLLSRLPGRCDGQASGPLEGVPIVAWIAHRSMPSHWGALSGPSLTVDASALRWPRESLAEAVAQTLQQLLGTASAPVPDAPLVRLVVGEPTGEPPGASQQAAFAAALSEMLERSEPVPPGPG